MAPCRARGYLWEMDQAQALNAHIARLKADRDGLLKQLELINVGAPAAMTARGVPLVSTERHRKFFERQLERLNQMIADAEVFLA
jgi:hypothetical protein